MAQSAERRTCPRCGANNFDTVSACWKCGTPLGSGLAGTPDRTAVSAPSPSPGAAPAGMPPVGPAAYGYPARRVEMPHAASTPAVASGDPGSARRAAIALALTFPWIGLPVGWIFMMIEDARKQAIGRICAVWSLFALIFHLMLMFALTQMAMSYVRELLPLLQNMRNSSAAPSSESPPGP